jgi:micrococcal nuclease
MRRAVLLLAVALAALAATLAGGRGDDPSAAGATARIERVVDGDTVVVRVDGRRERVRYIGIDTPESVRPDAPDECYGERAAAENRRLVEGRRVRLVLDVEERDRFGRLLAYVYRAEDGRFVNAALVRAGHARTLTIAPNVRFAARFARLAADARRAGRGLWSACGRA